MLIRLLDIETELSELTDLLHRSYAELGNMGLRYVATYQDDETTRRRVSRGECYVAEVDGRLAGTIVFVPADKCEGCQWYDRPEVASFGQFGVDPEMRGQNIGAQLLEFVESRARETGAKELALDTAEPAKHLIAYYERRGYRFIERVQWDVTNYASVILSKTL